MSLLLALPELGIAAQQFEPERADALSPERGGRLGGVTLGLPLWRAKWELSRNLTRDASDEWRAFVARCRGSQRAFVALDRDRLYPRAYPKGFAQMTLVGGAPFTGAAASWSQSVDTNGDATLALTGLPAGMVLGRGDYIGLRWDADGSPSGSHDRRTMARLVLPATVANDGTVDVLVEPPVPVAGAGGGVVPSGAEAHLDRPGCIMKLVTNETSLAALDRRQKIGGGTVGALQDLRE